MTLEELKSILAEHDIAPTTIQSIIDKSSVMLPKTIRISFRRPMNTKSKWGGRMSLKVEYHDTEFEIAGHHFRCIKATISKTAVEKVIELRARLQQEEAEPSTDGIAELSDVYSDDVFSTLFDDYSTIQSRRDSRAFRWLDSLLTEESEY